MARDPDDPRSNDITPEDTYHSRRVFMRNAGLATVGAAAFGGGLWALSSRGVDGVPAPEPGTMPGVAVTKPPLDIEADSKALEKELTTLSSVTTYNNFYEFGLGKGDPARNAGTLRPRPWTVRVEGECNKPTTFGIEDLLKDFPQEERIYRLRCVEAWSMVVPWLGFPLGALLDKVEPSSRAKYVALTTLHDPTQMPGQGSGTLDWPYVEGLRIDEAMHPLAILATGLYGKLLPHQNGAPLRLVVPWKYGFKGIKSIVKIALTERPPATTWNVAAPGEYGFFANVNPTVDHPRWTQATERRIGDLERRKTLMFNGYAAKVASLYASMDLRQQF